MRRVVLVVALGALGCAPEAGSTRGAEAEARRSAPLARAPSPEVAPIPVVHSVADLEQGPALALGRGKAWIGIERTQFACSESVLVYVLKRGSTPEEHGEPTVGGFALTVTSLDAGPSAYSGYARSDLTHPRHERAYAHAVGGLDPGRYRIQLEAGGQVAATEVHVTGEGTDVPWSRLGSARRESTLAAEKPGVTFSSRDEAPGCARRPG